MTEQVIRVVMADDHVRLRAVIRQALEQAGCTVVGEGATAVQQIHEYLRST